MSHISPSHASSSASHRLCTAASAKNATPISDSHVDLWEHASTLYHSFEWYEAADRFDALAGLLGSSRHKMRCLLNVSLIRARMGDFLEASHSLHAAAKVEPDMPLTVFLLGMVEWELGDTNVAEACFEHCLVMVGECNVDHHPSYLDFVLERDSIIHNLHAVKLASSDPEGRQVLTNMSALSAELLFEAPPRSNNAPVMISVHSEPQHFQVPPATSNSTRTPAQDPKHLQRHSKAPEATLSNSPMLVSPSPNRDSSVSLLSSSTLESVPSPALSESSWHSRLSKRNEAAKMFFSNG